MIRSKKALCRKMECSDKDNDTNCTEQGNRKRQKTRKEMIVNLNDVGGILHKRNLILSDDNSNDHISLSMVLIVGK